MPYRSQDLASDDFRKYINRLIPQIYSIYEVDPEQIKLSVRVKDVHFDFDRAMPYGLIVIELVSNSLKHSFPEGQAGEIIVEMSRDAQDTHMLIIKNTGVGNPEGFDSNSSPTLGTQLVADLGLQLGRRIEFHGGKGTGIRILF